MCKNMFALGIFTVGALFPNFVLADNNIIINRSNFYIPALYYAVSGETPDLDVFSEKVSAKQSDSKLTKEEIQDSYLGFFQQKFPLVKKENLFLIHERSSFSSWDKETSEWLIRNSYLDNGGLINVGNGYLLRINSNPDLARVKGNESDHQQFYPHTLTYVLKPVGVAIENVKIDRFKPAIDAKVLIVDITDVRLHKQHGENVYGAGLHSDLEEKNQVSDPFNFVDVKGISIGEGLTQAKQKMKELFGSFNKDDNGQYVAGNCKDEKFIISNDAARECMKVSVFDHNKTVKSISYTRVFDGNQYDNASNSLRSKYKMPTLGFDQMGMFGSIGDIPDDFSRDVEKKDVMSYTGGSSVNTTVYLSKQNKTRIDIEVSYNLKNLSMDLSKPEQAEIIEQKKIDF